jgi:hypothetical protein
MKNFLLLIKQECWVVQVIIYLVISEGIEDTLKVPPPEKEEEQEQWPIYCGIVR